MTQNKLRWEHSNIHLYIIPNENARALLTVRHRYRYYTMEKGSLITVNRVCVCVSSLSLSARALRHHRFSTFLFLFSLFQKKFVCVSTQIHTPHTKFSTAGVLPSNSFACHSASKCIFLVRIFFTLYAFQS